MYFGSGAFFYFGVPFHHGRIDVCFALVFFFLVHGEANMRAKASILSVAYLKFEQRHDERKVTGKGEGLSE